MHLKAVSHKLNVALAIFNTEGHASFVLLTLVGDVHVQFHVITRRQYAITDQRLMDVACPDLSTNQPHLKSSIGQ